MLRTWLECYCLCLIAGHLFLPAYMLPLQFDHWRKCTIYVCQACILLQGRCRPLLPAAKEAWVPMALNLCLLLHRVPEECPQEVADVIAACRRLSPQRRPTVQELYRSLLSAPSSSPLGATVSPSSITPLIPDSLLP